MASDPFEVLGVPRRFGLDGAALAQRHRDLSRALHPDRFGDAAPTERRAAIERAMAINESFRALRDPLTRAEALLAVHGAALDERARPDPAMLMEVMELREDLEAARGDAPRIESLRDAVARRVAAEESALVALFDADTLDGAALAKARASVVRMKYFRRFGDEADALAG